MPEEEEEDAPAPAPAPAPARGRAPAYEDPRYARAASPRGPSPRAHGYPPGPRNGYYAHSPEPYGAAVDYDRDFAARGRRDYSRPGARGYDPRHGRADEYHDDYYRPDAYAEGTMYGKRQIQENFRCSSVVSKIVRTFQYGTNDRKRRDPRM